MGAETRLCGGHKIMGFRRWIGPDTNRPCRGSVHKFRDICYRISNLPKRWAKSKMPLRAMWVGDVIDPGRGGGESTPCT